MAKNDFKAFATDRNANVMSQEEWEALPALLSGFTAGKASSAQVNKVIRQASFIAAALAQFVSDKTQRDVLDNGDLPGFVELLGSGFAVEYLSRKNPFGDIKSDGTVKTALENLGLSDVLHKGNFGVGSRLQGSAAGNSHVGGFMYEPYQANNLYPLSVALMQAAGPTSTEWAQLAVSYGGAFRAFLGRQTYNGNPEISELYHDQRKPSASDVGAQPLNATLTTLSGKDAAGLRSVLGLGTTATRNVGTGASQIPDMSSFLSGSTASAFWYKLPGGMVVMGGNASGIASGTAGNEVFFPIPFPNACSSVVVTLVSNGLYADTVSFNTYIPGTDRFNVYTNTSGTYAIYYLAFGS